jgi:DNA topoisomerase III
MENFKTEKPVTGFRGRSGRTFKAKLKLEQGDDGKWRVEFDEDGARESRPRPPAEEQEEPAASASGDGRSGSGDGAAPAEREKQPAR